MAWSWCRVSAWGGVQYSPPKVEVMGDSASEEEYVVERILEAKGTGKARKFLIKWEGYDEDDDNTWEPAKHLPDKMVAAFEAKEKKGGASKESRPAAAEESDADDSEESDADDEYVPPKKATKKPMTPAAEPSKKGKALASEKRVTPATSGTKRPAAAVDVQEQSPSCDSICTTLGSMDATSLKAFATALSKEGFPYKQATKKDELVADLCVVVRATYDGLCLVQATSSKNYVNVAPGEFKTETTWSFSRIP